MPIFVCVAYGDQAGYDRTPESLRTRAHEQDGQLLREGVLIGIAGIPVQVRNPTGHKPVTQTGSFMASTLPVAGFSIVDAQDLSSVIEKMALTPCAVANGVVEIWQLQLQP